MGSLCSKPEPPKVEFIDQFSIRSLTAQDKKAIHDSQKLVMGTDSFRTSAPAFFILLFEKHPYMIEYFEAFKGKKLSEIRGSKELRAHAVGVFYAIASCTGNLDDAQTMNDIVEKIASRHYVRNVTFTEMENLRHVFKLFLGKYPPAVSIAWDKFFKIHNAIYRRTCEDLAAAGIYPKDHLRKSMHDEASVGSTHAEPGEPQQNTQEPVTQHKK